MINYGRYKNIRNASWQALIDFQVSQLPVMLTDVAKQAGIKIIKNSDCWVLSNNQIGLSIYANNKWYIIYDDRNSKERCRFTIAHELGHIFLGHSVTNNGRFRTVGEIDKPEEEQAADMFAARLLAPACVLWGMELHSPKDIAQACNISYEAATYRAMRMEILYKRNMFLTSDLEKQVYSNFSEFINNYKKEE
nr:MAG TPA: IrrE protein [Caudovirales sp. ctMlE25]